MQGKVINGYTLKHLLGEGGMAEVWYAENEIGKPAAVKILFEKYTRNEQILERFHNEALVMVKLNHPNIRQVYNYGYIDNRHCIIMEYLEGCDLEALMQSGRRFTDEELRRWWNQTADALKYTHARGIVHRDIKPSNLFLDEEGNIKLLDFGIAKMMENASLTHTSAIFGTLMYMSPEQVKSAKKVDYRTDLYSLAVTFVYLLTGKKPYDDIEKSLFDIQLDILTHPLDMSQVPTEWRNFLMPYLEKNPEKRPELTPFFPLTVNLGNEDKTFGENVTSRENPIPELAKYSVAGLRNPHKADPQNPAPNSHQRKIPVWTWVVGALLALLVIGLLFLLKHKPDIEPIETIEPDGSIPELSWSMSKADNGDYIVTVGDLKYTMKYVEGGTFTMGYNDKRFKASECASMPTHQVTVSSYWIGETEVTQALWKAVMGNNPSDDKGDNLPVYMVTWNECLQFRKQFNEKLQDQLPEGCRFALPTEAEWEYAARGGKHSKHYQYAGSNDIDEVAWYESNCYGKRYPVKSKKANELGLYDMCGSVWEWCADWYGDYSSAPQTNPTGPSSGWTRVTRGGGCWNPGLTVGERVEPDIGSADRGNVGLRIVLAPRQ